ncbi:diversity-generating retroelement protein bAvd family protein [Pseudoalteromonas sp. KS88]|uniref:four helix bundle protein n=1 Tax=Pseudoalteromonas sp. KS88 TaxID=2109918 RepID=UPI001081D809|nr:four helix bundle protein [Pseudoalteromonas sp. KS88]TGE79849.1 diversity-generating retroelement protein bAvd family protein [Pseudoalteromonas sp. KS88]
MKYENLEVWKRSFKLSLLIYKTFETLRDYGLRDQMRRCAVSVPSNIAEGMERDFEKEKARFLGIAKGSIGELKTQIMISLELGYISYQQSEFILGECEIIGKMLGKLIKTIKNA